MTTRDRTAAVVGVVTTGASSTLMELASSSAATTTLFRSAYALPLLVLVALRLDVLTLPPDVRPALWAGALLGLDLVLWDHAIDDLGAGLSTVVQDTHVVVVAVLAWLLLGQRVAARTVLVLPVLLLGIALVGGVAGGSSPAPHPLRGTLLALASGVAYAGFVLLLAGRRPGNAVPFLLVATLATGLTALAAGVVERDLDLTPGWRSSGWLLLLAVVTQVIGWLVLTDALAGKSAVLASVVLLLQPVAALGYARALLGEAPAAAQLAGVVLVLGCVATVAAAERSAGRPLPVLEAA